MSLRASLRESRLRRRPRILLAASFAAAVAAVSAAWGLSAASAVSGKPLAVPTFAGAAPVSGGTRTEVGEIFARRVGTNACFYLRSPGTVGDKDEPLLVFVGSYSSSAQLALLGSDSQMIAAPGDTVVVSTPDSYISGLLGTFDGCPVGSGEVPVLSIKKQVAGSY